MKRLSILRTACVFVFCAATATASPAQVLTTLHSFGGSSTDCQSQPGCGSYPLAGLVQASDGNFYGTTEGSGGNNNCVSGCGTVFKITPSATLTTLYRFCSQANCADGESPRAGLVQASDGNFYGTTENGGANNCAPYYGCGTVFKITSSGALTTLHSFARSDGAYPGAGLVQASDGNFYGTTYVGGTNNYGTVFKITPQGTLTTLHSFDGSDGANPADGLLQASDGNFYGATSYGGASNDCYGGCGTVFKITSSGTLTTLHSFAGSDGANPPARLVQASDGNLYGTTYVGGADGRGTVFRLVTVRACAICPSIE